MKIYHGAPVSRQETGMLSYWSARYNRSTVILTGRFYTDAADFRETFNYCTNVSRDAAKHREMERQTNSKSNVTTSRLQSFAQKPKVRVDPLSPALVLGLPLLVFWWRDVEGLKYLGGLATLTWLGFGVHWYFSQNFDVARLFASTDDRDDDVLIEESIYWWAWGIGVSSSLSVYLLDANPVLTLALNAAIAFFGKYNANKSYAKRNAEDVDCDSYDESETVERLKSDPAQIGAGRAFISGIGIGAVLVHVEPPISLLAEHQPMLYVVYLTVLVPMLVFSGMTVAGKIDTVWAPERLFQREVRRRQRHTSGEE